jgi:hypothetical protein
MSPTKPASPPSPQDDLPAGSDLRSIADDWSEESSRQIKAALAAPAQEQRIFCELRRKVAAGETVSKAIEKVVEALRFSGRITLTFHQGKQTKAVLEECYYRGRPM